MRFWIERAKTVDEKRFKIMKALYRKLTDNPPDLTLEGVNEKLANKNLVLLAAKSEGNSGDPVGMATITFYETLGAVCGKVEDVIIFTDYRGFGIGKRLVIGLLTEASKRKAKYVELTSKPSRKAANKLYEKLGFKLMAKAAKDGTNYYRYTPQ